MEQLIYPITKRFIKVTAACFGISSALIGAYELGIQILLKAIHPALFVWFGLFTLVISFPLLLVSLSILCNWGTHVLLACRGNYCVRTLCPIMFIPALLAVLIPLADIPLGEGAYYLDNIRKAFFLLVATASFFAYPFTAGYPAKGRKLFLYWAISLVLFGLQDVIAAAFFHLATKAQDTLPALYTIADIFTFALLLTLRVAVPFYSIRLAWLLYHKATSIASMPEKIDPAFPEKEE